MRGFSKIFSDTFTLPDADRSVLISGFSAYFQQVESRKAS
uniref:Uncharacterized protein n=1 Tax=Candidatus Kentrum sp. TC TaxID=2126339 RepID=A0A450Y9Q8_9GAMM|nr:MAG: hypothetical protein BECKTC1821D_GA0114238_100414 [Candidatus Kentron sp. TC]